MELYLVAHKANCHIIRTGTAATVPVGNGYQDVAVICSCGGVFLPIGDSESSEYVVPIKKADHDD